MRTVVLSLLLFGGGVMRLSRAQEATAGKKAGVPAAEQPATLRIDDVAKPSERFPAKWYPAGDEVTPSGRPVLGAPYAATPFASSAVQAKPGEALIRKVVTEGRQFRDSAGRKRGESVYAANMKNWNESPAPRRRIYVADPVSHCNFLWFEPVSGSASADGSEPVATVTCFNRNFHYYDAVPFGPFDESMGAEAQVFHEGRNGTILLRDEPLGRKMVNGISALGVRHTAIFPRSRRSWVGSRRQR